MKLNSGFVLAFLILAFIGMVQPTSISHEAQAAGAWYVAVTGSDLDDCQSTSTPCATINGAIGKATSSDTIYIATGIYTNTTGSEVVLLNKDLTLSGGWNADFTQQTGMSTIDGEGERRCLDVSNAVATIDHFVIQNGVALYPSTGGGVHNSGTLSIIDSIITNNKGNYFCSGICNEATPLMRDNIVTNNTGGNPDIGDAGRRVVKYESGNLIIRNSTISNNQQLGSFPTSTILNYLGTVVITNSTISGNRGYAAINNGWGNMSLNSTTVTDNDSGLRNSVGELRLHNNILAGNANFDCTNNEASDEYPAGIVINFGYNLMKLTHNCQIKESDLISNPELDVLQNYGGPTPTNALLPSSPAINAGDPAGCTDEAGTPLLSDQRGVTRMGRCDIGAYEAGLTVTKSVNRSLYPVRYANFIVKLENAAHNVNLPNTYLTDILPSGLSFITGTLSTDNGAATIDENTIHWNGTIFSDTETTITFGAAISETVPQGTWITNSAVGSWAETTYTAQASFSTFLGIYLPVCLDKLCTQLFEDDFTTPASGWPVSEDEYVRFEYLNGEYRILSKQSGYLYIVRAPSCEGFQNYIVEIDARWEGTPGSSYGLIFGVTSGFSQYYLFDINTDYQMYRLYRRDASGFTRIGGGSFGGIHPGTATNKLKVFREGTEIDLVINDQLMGGTSVDSAITGLTYVGLVSSPYSNTPVSDARFDNFIIFPLSNQRATSEAMNSIGIQASSPPTTTNFIVSPDELQEWYLDYP